MIAPDEALAHILALAAPVALETVPLARAAGRWSAAPLMARRTQPARDLSAMDGYAIRHDDLPGPWRIAGEAAAGRPFTAAIGAGEAARIFTGAAVPAGADTVIVQEDVASNGTVVTLTGDGPGARGTHVRPMASDFSEGQCLLAAGERMTAARLALAASAGHATLGVRRRIRVALISTGDELVAPGSEPHTDCIPASNGVMLAALLGDLPVDVTDFGIVGDDRARLVAAFARADGHDILVTTGGASVGDHDLVRLALLDAGTTIDFWKIAMRPGKPLMAGRLGDAVVLGLAGNPVSAFVTAVLFLKPLIAHLSGARDPAPTVVTAILGSDMPAVGIRSDYVRAQWHEASIIPLSGDSGMLVPLACATALIVRPAGSPAARSGDHVTIISLT